MKITSQSPTETLALGKTIAKHLIKGDILCLIGQLGSGKTVLAKGLISGFGINKDNVISPTFVLMREYKTRLAIHHFDLYRLANPHDIEELGYEEYFYNQGVTVIEWADKLGYLMPAESLTIRLSFLSRKQRLLELTAFGKRYNELLNLIKEGAKRI